LSAPRASSTSPLAAQAAEAAAAVRERSRIEPRVAIILGTGLGSLADSLRTDAVIPYQEIPHFPVATAGLQAGELAMGTLGGTPVAVLRGRAHYYEGYTMGQVAFPVRALRALGADVLISTHACGGMNPLYELSDLCVVADHLNLSGDNPLLGPNDEALGPRFPDMSEPYDRALIASARAAALAESIPLHVAVYASVAGPNLETAAEYRFLRAAGGDVVGMSLVPETLVAVHGGMRVLALAVVTDLCLPDRLEPVSIPAVLAAASAAAPRLERLLTVLAGEDAAPSAGGTRDR
jgi:purine-nucleoside phosphorylase